MVQVHASGDLAGAEAEIRRGLEVDPQGWLLKVTLAIVLSTSERLDEAYEVLKGLRMEDGPEAVPADEVRAMMLNQRAWIHLLRGDPSRMVDAEQDSRQACALRPEIPSYADTLGHVLVWAGRPAEARSFFEFAHGRGELPQTKASSACGLALVCAAAGARADAERWLSRAREADPKASMLAPAEAAVRALA